MPCRPTGPRAATAIDRACRDVGFFAITGHGVDPALQDRLEVASHAFFERPANDKARIAMANAGAAWRGWFPVDGELTSGVPDRKEGIYFGAEHAADHPRVRSATALHGRNQFPAEPAELGPLVLEWLDAMRRSRRCGDERHGNGSRTPGQLVRRSPDGRSDHPVPHLPLPARRPPTNSGASASTPTTGCSHCSHRTITAASR